MSLLEQIRAGKQLRKVPESDKNDRSTLGSKSTPRSAAPAQSVVAPAQQVSNNGPPPPMGLGGLFANGMPKLRPSGTASGQPNRQFTPPPPPPPVTPPASAIPGGYAKHAAPPPPPPPPPTSPPPTAPPPPARPPSMSQGTYPNGSYFPAPYKKPMLNGTSTNGPRTSTANVILANSRPRPAPGSLNSRTTPPTPRDSTTGLGNKFFVPPPVPTIAVNRITTSPPAFVPLPETANTINPPPPPPPPTRKNHQSGTTRSQRAGLPPSDQERSTNAKPKTIFIGPGNSGTNARFTPPAETASAPIPPPPPGAPYAGSQQQQPRTSFSNVHPPAPSVPIPQGSSGSLGVAALSAQFEKRFQFLSDADLPQPPKAYTGTRSYNLHKDPSSRRAAPVAYPGMVQH